MIKAQCGSFFRAFIRKCSKSPKLVGQSHPEWVWKSSKILSFRFNSFFILPSSQFISKETSENLRKIAPLIINLEFPTIHHSIKSIKNSSQTDVRLIESSLIVRKSKSYHKRLMAFTMIKRNLSISMDFQNQ